MSPADRKTDDQGRQSPPDPLSAARHQPAGAERREAFARLFAQHDRWLFSYLVVLLGNPADAEEVFQEVCVVLWREHEKFEFGTKFVSWVSVIAHHQVHRFRAKSKRKHFPIDEALLGDIADTAIRRADIFEYRREALRNCLGKLSTADRQIVQRCYDQETANFKAAAQQLGRPVNTVYKALNRIRSLLHTCIDQTLAAEAVR